MQDLSAEYKRSVSWIQKQIFEYEPSYKIHNPRAVNIVCDTTFYGKRKDKLGTLVFKDSITKEVLIWKHIQSETIHRGLSKSLKLKMGDDYLVRDTKNK